MWLTASSLLTLLTARVSAGIAAGVAVRAVDLWTGADLGLWHDDRIAAAVAPHDTAALRLTPTPHPR